MVNRVRHAGVTFVAAGVGSKTADDSPRRRPGGRSNQLSVAVYTRSALDLLHYEDLELGSRWTTRGRTITDADLVAHAGVSGDFGFLHVDAPRAAQGHFGGRIAHGSLLISIALGLGSMDVPQADIVAMVGTTWRFLRAVKPGMTVHATWRLARKREVSNPRWGLAVWQVDLDDQNQERVLDGEVSVLVNRREVAAPVTSRSRRRRRGKVPAEAPAAPSPGGVGRAEAAPSTADGGGLPPLDSNLPEPVPAAIPAPAPARRRRPATPAPAAETQPTPPERQPEADATAVETAAPSSSSRRRRRRRGGGGGGGSAQAAGNGNGGGSGLAVAEPEPPPTRVVPQPPAAVESPRSQWATPEPARPAQPAAGNPVSRVLGRLRRPRPKPAAAAPEGTRSPSE